MERRDFLKLSLYASTLLVSGCGSGGISGSETRPTSNPNPTKTRQLPIPPLLNPTPDVKRNSKMYHPRKVKMHHFFTKIFPVLKEHQLLFFV